MPDQVTPRQMVKALVRGEVIARPLLLPVVFSLGSRLENLSLPEFLKNPTKIANASRQIRSTLKIDGVTCYWDPFLEAEALGASVEWDSAASAALTRSSAWNMSSDNLRQTVEAAGISKLGRIRVALEVLQRMKVMMRDEPALIVRATGPHTLATQLTPPADLPASLSPPSDRLDFAADFTGSLVKHYLESGADVVFLAESVLPTNSPEDFDRWRTLLDPVINVIRFFEALPVLLFERPISPQDWNLICAQTWECALCLPLPAESASGPSVSAPMGVSLPALDLTRPEAEFAERLGWILERAASVHASFLTSPDLPVTSDLKSLAKNLAALRAAAAC